MAVLAGVVESAIKEGAASKKQMEADLKDAQVGRVEAKDTIAKATAIREKEAWADQNKRFSLLFVVLIV